MTALELTLPPVQGSRGTPFWRLVGLETRRYARNPLFLLGVALTVVTCFGPTDPQSSIFFNDIVPAAGLGVLGLVAMASSTRTSAALSRSAGVTPVGERTQTGALAVVCLLPFSVGVAWFCWAVWAFQQHPVPPNGFPFGPVDDSWKVSFLFGTGAVSALGGPLLGIVIGRWWPRRGVAPLCAVLLVAAVIVMQGLFQPLWRVRLVMPWTHWGGPIGIDGDPNRMIILPGSPQWWVVYLFSLCGLAVVAALWHDPEARGRRLRGAGVVLLLVAVTTCLLAMFTGIDNALVNPIPSP